MKAKYSATFEFDEAPPLTARGFIEGGSLPTMVRRAAADSKRQYPKVAWRSYVIVLERVKDEPKGLPKS